MNKDQITNELQLIVDRLNLLYKEIRATGLNERDIYVYGNAGNSNCCSVEETNYDGVNLVWRASQFCEY